MNPSTQDEIVVSILLIVLLLLLLNPFGFWMPNELLYITVGGVFILVGIFGGLVWKESVGDEREQLHKMLAGRIGYLAGLTTLIIGVIIQSMGSNLDKWLILAIGAMVIGKLFGLYYARKRK
ncbi:MAG: hypothetical protein R3346_02130 [Candidatus Spechtbacterales bacterium]|nr:hypothetical protein [Candidatus Spechtbacterales bacterium]